MTFWQKLVIIIRKPKRPISAIFFSNFYHYHYSQFIIHYSYTTSVKLPNILNFFKRINYILVAAWVIPAAVLLTILYLNFLPFGYEKTLTINVGAKNDDKGEFRLEMSPALGSRQELDGQTFRYLDGLAYAVYEPKVVLRNATIEAELTASSGVSFILPPDLTDVKWDYDWNAQNIEQYFQAELSEKQIFEKFQNTTSTAIAKNSFVIASETKQSTLNGINATCQKNAICYKDGFALELQYQADRYATLLSGSLSLNQTPKELVLTYKGKKIKYQLPDYYLGETHTVIIAFDGEKLYLTTDKNEGTKAMNLVIAHVVIPSEVEGSLSTKTSLSQITIYKSKSVQSLSFHPNKPSFIDTKDGSIILDGSTRLVMPNTADKFEDGPFTVYAEWTPEKAANGQQIIGHYNWEIWQNEKTVSFQVGRMSSSTGPMYKISYNVDESFFNKSHTLLAVYSPVSTATSSVLCHPGEGRDPVVTEESVCKEPITNGYIEFFVDNIFAGREYLANETIWLDYNGNQNLSIGWTPHNNNSSPIFSGDIYSIKISKNTYTAKTEHKQKFNVDGNCANLPIYGTGELNTVKIKIKK